MWKEISAPYSRYQIDKVGNIRRRLNDGTFRNLKPGVDSTGYRRVLLYAGGKRKPFRVHQLVAKMWVEPFKGHHIQFVDGKKNINASNLKWIPKGDVGVYLDKKTGNYLSVAYKKGRKIFKGYHPSKELAQKARHL